MMHHGYRSKEARRAGNQKYRLRQTTSHSSLLVARHGDVSMVIYPANSTKRFPWLTRSTSILLMMNVHMYAQQTNTSTVSDRPTTEQPVNRPPITEHHQGDQPGTPSLSTRSITKFHSRQNQLLHYDLCDQLQNSTPNSTQQNDQSLISNQRSD